MHPLLGRCILVGIVVLVTTFGSSESGKLTVPTLKRIFKGDENYQQLPGGGFVLGVANVKFLDFFVELVVVNYYVSY